MAGPPPDLALPRILLLTSRSNGEEVAARNLRDALEQLAPRDVRLEVVDLLDSGYGRYETLRGEGDPERKPKWRQRLHARWRGTPSGREDTEQLRDSLHDVIQALQPDVVVSCSRLYGTLLDEIYRHGRVRDFTLISLVTDHLLNDAPWPRETSDFYAVTSDATARELASAGVPPEKVKVFGFPVHFSPTTQGATAPELSARERPRILYLINCARKKAPKLLDRLLEQTDWRITACIDGDLELEEIARVRAASAPDRLEIMGDVRDWPTLLRQHHIVISRASTSVVQEAIAARCPLLVPKIGSPREENNFALLRQANAGTLAEKPREVVAWLERAFRDEGKLLALWRKNLEPLGRPDGALHLARFILQQASNSAPLPAPDLRALPPPKALPAVLRPRLRRLPKGLLLCDLHTHTTWSDGKLTIPEMVDFYGQRGFDCLCITDHLCDPKRLLGKLVNLTGLVIAPDGFGDYLAAIEREKKRAWAKYDLLLMAGVEFNKDGYTAKTSTHLLGVDLKQPIDPSLDIKSLIREIHAQGALAIASHPHEMKSQWGKDTLYLWEHVDEYAPLLDAWEVANRDDIFNPVGLKKLPFIASSDFHKPKHIHSWKTLLYCEKEAEAIKHCIRVNRDVSLTLYRDHRFGLDDSRMPLLEDNAEAEESGDAKLTAKRG